MKLSKKTKEKQRTSFDLTEREKEVLILISKGLSNKEIAEKLIISILTLRTYIHNIYGKLGISKKTNETSTLRVRAALFVIQNKIECSICT